MSLEYPVRVTYELTTDPPMTQSYFFHVETALESSVSVSEGAAALAAIKAACSLGGQSDAEVSRRCAKIIADMLAGALETA